MKELIVKDCHQIMGEGLVDVCKDLRESPGCNVCCNDGSELVPGEGFEDESLSLCPVTTEVSESYRKKVRMVYDLLMMSGIFVEVR